MTATHDLLRELRSSHDDLSSRLRAASDADLSRTSGSSEWTVAQVASHLGSQAEIFQGFLDAGLSGAEAPSNETFPAIWDAWNSRTPREQADDSVAVNGALLQTLEGLDDAQLGGFRLSMFGMDIDADRFLRMRLSEHALHSWDVAVAFDPAAQVAPGAVALLVDGVGETAARGGRPSEQPRLIEVDTSDPDRRFVLDTGGVTLVAAPAAGGDGPSQSVRIPAEALVRLVYGRVSDKYPPRGEVRAVGVDLQALTEVFPGF